MNNEAQKVVGWIMVFLFFMVILTGFHTINKHLTNIEAAVTKMEERTKLLDILPSFDKNAPAPQLPENQ